jgi:3-oxoadipate enol-lactonase
VRLEGYKKQAEAVLKHDTFERLPQIKAPTLVFGGRYDGSCPPDITRAMAAQIPGRAMNFWNPGTGIGTLTLQLGK